MTIAAHFFASPQVDSYLSPVLLIIAKENPQEEFIFLIDKNMEPLQALPNNCKVINVSPGLRNGLLMHYWYNFKLPAILKKYNVSALITETGVACLRTNTPQCLLLKEISFLKKNKETPTEYSFYIKKFFSRFLHKTSAVLVAENFMMPGLLYKFPSLQQKLSFAGHGLNDAYQPMQLAEKETRLHLHTDGHEYFLCECSPATQPHIVLVLKAYSIFKKRLKSNMRLMFLLRDVTPEECVKDFKNYKFRNEVKFLVHQTEEETAALVGAAYAFIHLPSWLITGAPGLNAMQCGVPIITYDHPDTQDLYADAALYAGSNEKIIADNMMMLYKDETARNGYINKGYLLTAAYNWPDVAHRTWQTILSISRD